MTYNVSRSIKSRFESNLVSATTASTAVSPLSPLVELVQPHTLNRSRVAHEIAIFVRSHALHKALCPSQTYRQASSRSSAASNARDLSLHRVMSRLRCWQSSASAAPYRQSNASPAAAVRSPMRVCQSRSVISGDRRGLLLCLSYAKVGI